MKKSSIQCINKKYKLILYFISGDLFHMTVRINVFSNKIKFCGFFSNEKIYAFLSEKGKKSYLSCGPLNSLYYWFDTRKVLSFHSLTFSSHLFNFCCWLYKGFPILNDFSLENCMLGFCTVIIFKSVLFVLRDIFISEVCKFKLYY